MRSRQLDPGFGDILDLKLLKSLRALAFEVCLCRLLAGFCFLACLVSAAAGDAQPERTQTSIAVEALSRLKGIDLEANPALKTAVLKVLDQVRGTPQFLEIVHDFKIKGQGREVAELGMKNPADSSGVEAMRVVLAEQDFGFLAPYLTSSNAPNLIKLLGNTGDRQIVPLLLPIVKDSSTDITLRKLSVRSLAQAQDGAKALLDLAQEQKLPEELKLTAGSALGSAQWPAIKSRAAELLPLPQGKNATPLPPISELAKLKGDPVRGGETFRSETVGCNKCHQVNGDGVDFGPNLSDIGGKLGKDALYESILDPSAGISFGYEAWQLELKNGKEVYGLIVSETSEEIAMKFPGGIVMHYGKKEVLKRQKQKLSIMPAGLQQTMTKEELVDLVEYLLTLRKHP